MITEREFKTVLAAYLLKGDSIDGVMILVNDYTDPRIAAKDAEIGEYSRKLFDSGKANDHLKNVIERKNEQIGELKAENEMAIAKIREWEAAIEPDRNIDAEFQRLKAQLTPENWTVQESRDFYSFFVHGWYGRMNEAAYQKDAPGVDAPAIEAKLSSSQQFRIQEVRNAYLWIRENNHDIPDDTLDLMKNAAIEAISCEQGREGT